MKVLFFAFAFFFSNHVFAAADFECSAALVEIDKSESWGFKSVEPSSVEVIESGKNEDGNKLLALKHIFKDQKMEIYTTVISSDLSEPDYFWSSLSAVWVTTKGTKKSVLGYADLPHSSDTANGATLNFGNRVLLDQLIDIPGILSNTADQAVVQSRLKNGDLMSASVTCERIEQ
jgi:hypothetical protein